jgi:hypothetical protein
MPITTVHDLSTLSVTRIEQSDINARNRGELAFSYVPDLAGGTSVAQDDMVIFSIHNRNIYKGIVKKITHSLKSEEVKVTCQSVDNFVNGQTWVPKNRFYNRLEQTCESYPIDQTLQQFITAEYQGEVATWFNSITVAATLQDLIIPATSTYRRGFLEVLDSVLKPFPFASWRIDFTDDTTGVFPVGDLVIYDLRYGLTPYILKVGSTDGTVTSLEVTESVENCAEEITVFARGRFVERLELLRPNWFRSEEEIWIDDVYIAMPDDENGTSKLPEGHEFIQDITIYAENTPYHAPPGVGVITNNYRLWQGADYKINAEDGTIVWLKPEEGGKWWWVNAQTGQVAQSVSEALMGNLQGSLYRRPVAYANGHLTENAVARASYFHIGERPYRAYTTLKPIVDMRLFTAEEDEIDEGSGLPTGGKVTRFRKAPSSFDIYIPTIALERFVIETKDEVELTDTGLLAPVTQAARDLFTETYRQVQLALNAVTTPEEAEDLTLPEINAWQLYPPYGSVDDVLKWFSLAQTDAKFEEGTNCLLLGQRQLLSIPEWIEDPNGMNGSNLDAVQEATRPVRTGWATWAVLAHYTAWEEYKVTRTNTIGAGREARIVANSAFSYTNSATYGLQETGEILYDNKDNYLDPLADAIRDFYAIRDWVGSVSVAVPLNISGKYEIPYNVGDKCTLSGALNPSLAAFNGIIRSIRLDSLDEGIVTLEFGKMPPRMNPFTGRPDSAADIEGEDYTGEGAAGLELLGDR